LCCLLCLARKNTVDLERVEKGGDCVSEEEGYDLEDLRELREEIDALMELQNDKQADLEELDEEEDSDELEEEITELDDLINEKAELLADIAESIAKEVQELTFH